MDKTVLAVGSFGGKENRAAVAAAYWVFLKAARLIVAAASELCNLLSLFENSFIKKTCDTFCEIK